MTNDWKNIDKDFTPELQKEWEEKGFNYEQTGWWIGAGLQIGDANFAYWLKDTEGKDIEWVSNYLKYGDEQELRKKYKSYGNNKETEEIKQEIQYRNILLIGRTGNGKSALANVLANKEGEFEEFFKEGRGSTSETRKINDKLFEINGIKYRIIDTPGLGDTKLTKIQTLQEIAKVYDKVKDGLSQILFVNNGKFTPEEVDTYNTLKEILFDENITKYTTIMRTNFAYFEDKTECENDIHALLTENNKAIVEMIESCDKRIIHVDNPPLNIIGKRSREQNNLNKEIRSDSRKILINHLAKCDKIYKPESIEILNKIELKERYKAFGLCEECSQTNTWYRWCKSCSARHFTEEFENWSGGNSAVDNFIQWYQLNAINKYGVLEWIPYEKFRDIEYLAEGGFGKIYKVAEWVDRQISYWNMKDNDWERDKFYPDGVILKILTNSQNITDDFLREVAYYKLFKDEYDGVVKCFGISQDPQTSDYIMVMDYIKNGDLRKYLTNYYKKLDFYNKLGQSYHLAKGLNNIHRQGLVHRDFHPGNILISNSDVCLITDLGLCRPVDEKDKEEKVYGVLPYVAPEVLQSKAHTQAADIYSWGIVVYELFAGRAPYHERADGQLALKICQGLRPNFANVRMPKLLESLIRQCWDADPSKRPTANKLFKIINIWLNEIKSKKDTEFYRQYQDVEELTSRPNRVLDYQTDSQAIYTSRLLDTDNLPEPQNSQEINKQFYELYTSQYDFNLEEKVEDWAAIHNDFDNEDIRGLWSKRFIQQEIKELFKATPSLNPAQDYEFVLWLEDTKKLTLSNPLSNDNLERLRNEYQRSQQQSQILQSPTYNIPGNWPGKNS
ncbi:protein kinase [endosymbiont GvMRE of Glomus versiforme]|uniref:protein kinase n=1 Tax=endosymbiont GvMRE of Glomus versiforme TaxID=2039283 RepID=UPI000EBCA39B|nr:protein kinase [endosymbiont GvMRE of Glomus versiforme]RHZ35747.1 Cdc15p [endosymbiont GvMRE of Glomus versiforme]